MGFFNWFSKKIENTEKKEIITKPEPSGSSELVKNETATTPEIVYQSPIPESCSIGNLVYEKKYQEAIDLGLKLLEKSPNDCSIHINLMEAYLKGRELSPEYFDKSTYHAKQSILLGHTSGYAHERLGKNLDKGKKYHQSLQLYNLILDNKEFHFSSHGCGNGIDFGKRRASILAKMDKATDKETDILFTEAEITQILQSIKDEDIRVKEEQEATEKRLAEMEANCLKEAEELRRALYGK